MFTVDLRFSILSILANVLFCSLFQQQTKDEGNLEFASGERAFQFGENQIE